MELSDYLRIARIHWRAIVACGALGVVLAGLWTLQMPRVYSATATAMVSAGPASDPGLQSLGDALSKSKVKSYVELVKDRATADLVSEELGYDVEMTQVSVEQPLDTSFMRITATSPSPAKARDIADAWVTALAERVAKIETPDGESPESGLHIVKSASAVTPTAPSSPRVDLNLALGLMAGLGVGLAYALLRHRLDRKLRLPEEVEREFGYTVVGTIPDTPDLQRGEGGLAPLVVLNPAQAGSISAEAIRKLRTNLTFMDVDNPPRVIVMTSPHQGDGKSTVVANLAASIALSGEPVTLIDGDLRRPTVAKSFGLAEGVGLTDVLVGRMSAADAIQPHADIPGLSVLAAGSRPPNPSELLGSRAMGSLLEELGRDGMVLIDAPPLLPVTDAAVLARNADGALITVSAGKTIDTELTMAINAVLNVQSRVLGIVFNRISKRNAGSMYDKTYEYQYQYKYAYYTSGKNAKGGNRRAAPEKKSTFFRAP